MKVSKAYIAAKSCFKVCSVLPTPLQEEAGVSMQPKAGGGPHAKGWGRREDTGRTVTNTPLSMCVRCGGVGGGGRWGWQWWGEGWGWWWKCHPPPTHPPTHPAHHPLAQPRHPSTSQPPLPSWPGGGQVMGKVAAGMFKGHRTNK